uniref:Uncharacterized protein n=1 Tax=Panagrolaimus superbus TaxID=310955 RepID=A0A914YHC7_9BILA
MDLGLLFRILLFLASLGTLILAVSRYLTLSEQLKSKYGDVGTCVFQWAEWSQCSASCTTPGQNATRTRYVIPETVVDMSDAGIFSSLFGSKCYNINQISLCNLYE